MGPPSSCISVLEISVCAIRLGLRSPEDGRPRDGCTETDDSETDVPETDVAESDAPETDVPETEEDRDGRCVFLKIVKGLGGYYCLISFNGVYGSTDV